MKRKNFVMLVSVFLIVGAICVGSGFLLFGKFTHSMYPFARPMPPVVGQSMEEILAQLEVELKSNAPQVLTNLQPGLSGERIKELEQQSGVHLPEEIKALYQWRNGFSRLALKSGGYGSVGPMPGHYFVPLEEAFEMSRDLTNQVAGGTAAQRAAFTLLAGYTKSWITLFDEGGGGNGYFYDPKRKPAEGAIFFHDMEEGDYTFFPSPKNLFAGLVECYRQNAFVWKEGTNGASLSEDFEASQKIWKEFGTSSDQE
jgi:cell wall assembly regulator SMI1